MIPDSDHLVVPHVLTDDTCPEKEAGLQQLVATVQIPKHVRESLSLYRFSKAGPGRVSDLVGLNYHFVRPMQHNSLRRRLVLIRAVSSADVPL